MLGTDLFHGEHIYLAAVDAKELGEAYSRWSVDSEYYRLLTTDLYRLRSTKTNVEWLEKQTESEESRGFNFAIRTHAGDRLVGSIGLSEINWASGEAWVGIGLGERTDWGKGYGTDAMRVLLRYVFSELNLNRVTLDVFEYNPRAIRSYEKAGFTVEGVARKFILRDGRRWDLVYMGILREEWERLGKNGFNHT